MKSSSLMLNGLCRFESPPSIGEPASDRGAIESLQLGLGLHVVRLAYELGSMHYCVRSIHWLALLQIYGTVGEREVLTRRG